MLTHAIILLHSRKRKIYMGGLHMKLCDILKDPTTEQLQSIFDGCSKFTGNLVISNSFKEFHMGIYVDGNINAPNTTLHVQGALIVEGSIACAALHVGGPIICLGSFNIGGKKINRYADDHLMDEEE